MLHPLVLGVVIITSVVLEGPPVLVAVVLVSKAVEIVASIETRAEVVWSPVMFLDGRTALFSKLVVEDSLLREIFTENKISLTENNY